MRFVPNRVESGIVIRALLEFQRAGLSLFNVEPEDAIEEIEQLKLILAHLQVDADARDNVLGQAEEVKISQEHMEQRGLKLLVPYRGIQPLTARLRLT